MSGDLFAHAAEERLAAKGPLADRLRPRSLDEVVGQAHLLARGRPLRSLVDADGVGSIILWGPPGTGKTTLARLIAEASSSAFVALSAVTASVRDIRAETQRAQDRLGQTGQGTMLFLDEIHRFTRSQQDALLPAVETGLLTLIGATTENPLFEVNAPLRSRSTLFRLEPLDDAALAELAERALAAEGAAATSDAISLLSDRSGGDGRRFLTSLEVAVALAETAVASDAAGLGATAGESMPVVDVEHIEAALGATSIRYGRDDHYDVISAFIKSIRGSDVDAALHWLARMLEAGEDPRFIARRLLILASEDVGLADPMGLVIADAGARAVDRVGLPEAQLTLAQVVIHLATAPKSNSVTTAIGRALADVRSGPVGEVPPHLRDGHHSGAAGLGHGVGYRYPHDDPSGWVDQEYLPDGLRGRRYYEPSPHGREPSIADRRPRPDPPSSTSAD